MTWADRLRFWLVAAILAGINLVAIASSWQAATVPWAGMGGGPFNSHWKTQQYLDGRIEFVVTNRLTGATLRREITRSATPMGQARVWWPVALALWLSLPTVLFVRTDQGRRILRAVCPPRLTTRGWMIVVALIGMEGGLVVSTMRTQGINPIVAPWSTTLLYLAILHVLAFLPAGLVWIVSRHWGSATS